MQVALPWVKFENRHVECLSNLTTFDREEIVSLCLKKNSARGRIGLYYTELIDQWYRQSES